MFSPALPACEALSLPMVSTLHSMLEEALHDQ